jgi:threonine/homoserine/homoserine lactone efflux protein
MFEVLGVHDLAIFIIAGLLLNLTPGPDTVYIGSRTATGGFRAGLAALSGIAVGCLIHTVAAAVGLSAIMMASAEGFLAIKLIGAAYLVYAGIQMLREHGATSAAPSATAVPNASLSKIFWQGFLTNVLNPKVAVFFLAFLPQFIDAQSSHKTAAFLVLGVIFVLNSLFVTVGFAALVARAGQKLSGNPKVAQWLTRSGGVLFLGLGIKLAISERPI